MKLKHLFFMSLLPVLSWAQLSQTFDGVTLNSSGRGNIPATWKQYNVDNKTPASQLSYFGTNAWITVSNGTDTFAASHSWYNPAAASNDWLVSPSVTIPASGTTYVTFAAMAPDADFPDGFSLKLSTTTDAVASFTTNLLTVAAAEQSFTSYAVDLSAYAGQTIYLAWVNQSNDMFLLFLDDIQVSTLPALDVAVTNVTLPRLSQVNFNNTVVATFKNLGYTTVNNLTINWTDGGTPNSETLSSLNLGPFQEYTHTFSAPFNKSNVDEFAVSANVGSVNGSADPVAGNNSLASKISTIANNPFKRVLIEEGTGTWCQWCPRGAVAMDYMIDKYPSDFIGIAVHNDDPMTVTAYDAAAGFSGFPGCNADRVILGADVSIPDFEDLYSQRKSALSPAVVGGVWSFSGNQITIEASAVFRTKFSDDVRLAAIVMEDSVTGTGAGYNQSNAYAGGGNGVMGGFEALPNPVPAAQMVYSHVGRALLGGYNGQQGSVSLPATDGMTATHTYSYTVPATQDLSQIKIVVVLVDNNTGEVYNSYKLDPTVDVAEIAKPEIQMAVFPSPAAVNSSVNVSFQLEQAEKVSLNVYSLDGKRILSQQHAGVSGAQNLQFSTSGMASGNYLVSVSFGKYTYTQQFSVVK